MFKGRLHEKEYLDLENNINHELLNQNLNEFIFINKWFGTNHTLIDALNLIYDKFKIDFLNLNKSDQKIKIADLGCGAGDSLIVINEWAKNKNLNVELFGIDSNSKIIEFAENYSKKINNIKNSDINYKTIDILSDPLNNFQSDIICLNNICHHFSDQELSSLLKKLMQKTNYAIIINDLRREPLPFYLIKYFTKFFRFSKYAQNDGPLSVKKSFKKQDLINLMNNNKIKNYCIKKTWAFRWQVIIHSKSF